MPNIRVEKLLEELSPEPTRAIGQLAIRILAEFKNIPRNNFETTLDLFTRFQKKYVPALDGKIEKIRTNLSWSDQKFEFKLLLEDLAKKEKAEAAVQTALDGYKAQIALLEFSSATLSVLEKAECHAALSLIRQIVDESGLSPEKKNAILERVNQLAAEIDKNITRTDGVMALFGDIMIAYNSLTDEGVRAINATKKLMRIVLGRRASDQGMALPSSEKTRILE